MRIFSIVGAVALAPLLCQCGVLVMQKDFDALAQEQEALQKSVTDRDAEIKAIRAELNTTRERLENALRANADASSDFLSEKARIQEINGRLDETTQQLDDIRKEIASSRAAAVEAPAETAPADPQVAAAPKVEAAPAVEAAPKRATVDLRAAEAPQTQPAQPARTATLEAAPQTQPAPKPAAAPAFPADRNGHFLALRSAFEKHDVAAVRTLGHKFLERFASDDRGDEVLYMLGDTELKEQQPAVALGSFNRLLKQYPSSKFLDRALYDMGEAYLALHDCANAKTAFSASAQRSAKKSGSPAHEKLTLIQKNAPGFCSKK